MSKINKDKPHRESLPSERVKNNRVITVNGIWVGWGQANIPQLHLVAGDPMVHYSKAWIKWRPTWKTKMEHISCSNGCLYEPKKCSVKSFFPLKKDFFFSLCCCLSPLFLTKNGWSSLHSAVSRPSSGEPGSKVSLRAAWPKDTVSSWFTNFSPSEPYLCTVAKTEGWI